MELLENGVICIENYYELYLHWKDKNYKHVKYNKKNQIRCSWPEAHQNDPKAPNYHISKEDFRLLFIKYQQVYPAGLRKTSFV